MSSEQSLDPHLIEQTKQQIRTLVAEISALSKEDISPEEFYGGFLDRVVAALAATGGAVWTANEDGRLALQYQINLQETRLRESEEAQIQHSRLLYKTYQSNEGALVPPHSGSGDEEQGGNPTEFLLVLGLLKTDLEPVGLVEIFQRAEAGPSAQKGYLRFLMQMCDLAADFLKSHQLRHFSDRQSLWTQLEDFTRTIHASLDPRTTSYTIANEGRRLIECDRLSVAIQKGKKCIIEAISGQDVFDKRSNHVRLLNKLAAAVTATGEAVWYSGDTQDLAPQVEEALQEYVDEAHSKTVAILPLLRPEPKDEEDDPKKRKKPSPPIGALIVEQIEDSRVPSSMVQRVEVVSRHSSSAMGNALEHQSLFLMPLWRTLGKTKIVTETRHLPKTISIGGAIIAILLILGFLPARFELESKGTLEPIEHRNVFASEEGVVEKLFVKHGDTVRANQELAMLRSSDLDIAIEKVQQEQSSKYQEYMTLNRDLNAGTGKAEDLKGKQGRKRVLTDELKSLNKQLELYRQRKQGLVIRSPIDGVVVTWDLKKKIEDRYVQKGWLLLSVADPTKDWQLELHMPEQRMGHIAKEQQKLFEKSREKLRQLLTEEAKATLPATPESAEAIAATESAAATETPGTAEATTTPEEKISAWVEAELAKVPPDQSFNKCLELINARFHKQIEELAAATPEGEIRDKLKDILSCESYGQAQSKLGELLAGKEEIDPELKAKLTPLQNKDLEGKLEVKYYLATDSSKTHVGWVKEIHRSAEIMGEEGNTVLIKVAINKEEISEQLQQGATVGAKVYCGYRPLGYVLLHDVFAFVQTKIIFRYF